MLSTRLHHENEIPRFRTFEDAYMAMLRRTRDTPEFRNAPRGNLSRELLGVSYRIEEPRERVIRNRRRRSNIVFNFAEVLWYLSGGNDLEFIAHYANSIRRYSADGSTLRGTAYGPRIFGFGGAGINQWESVVRTLEVDPDSKRAFVQVFAPEELLIESNIDVACTIGLQFFIRSQQLHAVGFMRANDAFRGAVSDVFSFTMLQELLARQLGLELGSYTHSVGSYHLYAPDDQWADSVLAGVDDAVDHSSFPAMPVGDNWPAVRQVLELEYGLRKGLRPLSDQDLRRLDLPDYWRQVVVLLALQARATLGEAIGQELVDQLCPLFKAMFENNRSKRAPLGATGQLEGAG